MGEGTSGDGEAVDVDRMLDRQMNEKKNGGDGDGDGDGGVGFIWWR